MRDWASWVRRHLPLTDLAPEREARIVREIASQLEDVYRDARARGMDDAGADAVARAQIPDWTALARDVRRADRPHLQPVLVRAADALTPATTRDRSVAARGGLMLARLIADSRFAVRQLVKTPAFSLVAVLTLALGIGATTAIFSVVNGVLLRPLPFANPDGLMRVHEVVPQYGRFSVAPATFLDWRDQNGVFERIAAYTTTTGTIVEGADPERLTGAAVSWDIFELLGISPAMGSGFTPEQDAVGANNVILLSHGAWQRRFGGDPGIAGRTIRMNGVPVTIAGVMPAGFYFPTRTAEFWRPIALPVPNPNRGGHFLGVVGRLKTGVTQARADAEMKAISERLAKQYPDSSANETAEIVPLHEQVVGSVRRPLVTLLAAVSVVILIACANVANLLLVRASVREKELAVRTALGAGRGRLAAQMLVESLLLAGIGGVLGIGLAAAAVPLVQSLGATSIPRVADVTIDVPVLLFALGASLLTGLLFGLAPAWQASHASVGTILKESSRSSTAASGRWVRSTLLVVEVALSIVLLVGATLLLRSFAKLTGVDPGFDASRVLAFQITLPQATYATPAAQSAFFDRLIEQVDALPEVTSAGMMQRLPLRGGYVLSFAIRGRAPAKPGEEPSANHRVISPELFKTLGIPIRRGRAFTDRDATPGLMVAVIDEAFAARHFPNEDPIGQGIDIGNGSDGFYEIVGIAANVRDSSLEEAPAATMYVPYKQDVFSAMWVLARTDGDPLALAPSIRSLVRGLDAALPAASMDSLAHIVSDSVSQQRFSMLLLTLFAGIALFLAAVGLYGVVAYTVSQRTREIGVRMAIGAAPSHVLRLVVGGGMKLVLAGVVVGLIGAFALARSLGAMLFEVTPADPVSYAGTTVMLLVVAALACLVPARRAMRVDPIVAMHGE